MIVPSTPILSLFKAPTLYAADASAAGAAAGAKKEAPSGVGLYLRYALGGALCCSITHAAVVPVDVVKTRLQLFPGKYKGMIDGFKRIPAEEGAMTLLTGLGPTAVGYAAQGAFKFGFYEAFKAMFINMVGWNTAVDYRTSIFLASSAMAETIADLALCPMEATRIRMVSDPTFAKGLADGVGKIVANEGVVALYKGLPPILLKQVPYTMAKFVVFERAVEAIYKTLNKDKNSYTKAQQVSVSLGGGLISGAVAAVISHPADTILTKVNKVKTDGGVMDALKIVVKETPFSALWLGLGARILMVAGLTCLQFGIYDSVKVMFGIPPAQPMTKK
ncbi:mitochondrial solute carrier family 25 (mitochondrial phosphate transporter) member 3 [Andalucia godoyi]|uniref:Mitochondrial solute carrier family 25 (Mitochondrial phosphate transporter) member 3 n=1 Tax=Andalucia godoyi TaxID=505711 RepID=A0A8K0AI15_ANDGO|nr:mitochondrial solute carrier family 25 (mitochondrial phosphate transporter) member 3 [Andalucia godoyi]|eukprot:ANDGO_00779.mRNA.1 mitochondrial solute carrier family 25 (mitochondrial phosphate transporter) member 3